ncbi:flagellar protein FlaG [Franzmannia qiaohouensis]|uniref:Flagellar protein FlaG n=1 Tax=Franzmannia qiaohouensis TaxID=1329370 RepID=A0ABU1HEY6_9GAMM|nr:flagellar protein FlaG [Halomonas qiaohouensis]MDR5906040.1 flagellar protein FlaG [Halomonas qiaohouensis]
MSDLINDISPATRGLTAQQRLDSMLVQLGHSPLPTPESQAERGAAALPPAGDLIEPVLRINEVMRPYGVEFHLNEFDSRTVARIVDRDSGDVIRQIPSEEVLRIAESLSELQGRLINLEV